MRSFRLHSFVPVVQFALFAADYRSLPRRERIVHLAYNCECDRKSCERDRKRVELEYPQDGEDLSQRRADADHRLDPENFGHPDPIPNDVFRRVVVAIVRELPTNFCIFPFVPPQRSQRLSSVHRVTFQVNYISLQRKGCCSSSHSPLGGPLSLLFIIDLL